MSSSFFKGLWGILGKHKKSSGSSFIQQLVCTVHSLMITIDMMEENIQKLNILKVK